MSSYAYMVGGVAFVFIMTCLGSATVFFFHKPVTPKFRQIFLGFAAGIMIAAAVWSLLIPAMEEAETAGVVEWLPIMLGFALGVLFLLSLDHLIPHLHPFTNQREGGKRSSKRSALILSAIILHNIPEGIAVGLSFALVAGHNGSAAAYAPAIALAIGIGIHNFPEGATISLLFRQEGASTLKSFLWGCLAGAVDLFFAVLTIFFAAWLLPAMPWLLAFAAGAMLYVVVEELIPEAHMGAHSHMGTLAVMAGFLLMMALDIALG